MKKFAVIGALTLCAAPCFASDIAFIAVGPMTPNSGGSVNLGMAFTPLANVGLDALGFFDDGLGTTQQVALFDMSGTLLASTSVNPSTATKIGGYWFASIAPLTLSANQEYLVDEFSTDGNWDYQTTAPATAPQIQFDQSYYVYSTTMQFPTSHYMAQYFGPNVEIVPEPGSFISLGFGAGTLIIARRRRFSA